MKAIRKYLVDILDAWIEGRKKYLEYKQQK